MQASASASVGGSIAMMFVAQVVSGCAVESTEPVCAASIAQPIVNGDARPTSPLLPTRLARNVGALEDEYENLRCTGVAIAARWVLSAAHCVGPGLRFRSGDDGDAGALELEEPIVHPDLDLALLRVREAPSLGEAALHSLALRTDEALGVGAAAVLGGVGLNERGARGLLAFVEERVVALDDTSITVDGRGKSGACAGDSGGPLFADLDGTGEPALVGILSMGSRSCLGIDRYTRIGAARRWIAQTTRADVSAAALGDCRPHARSPSQD